MTPIERASLVYANEACARTFQEDLEAHFLHGHVYSTPDFFIMFRYVCRSWDREIIVDPWQNPPGDPDTMMVYLASGDISKALTFPHKVAEFMAFERFNHLRFYRYELLRNRLLQRGQA